jgi:phosphotransferase system IIB component
MVAELLHLFYSEDMEEHSLIGKALIELLTETTIAPEKKKIITLFIAQKSYFEYADSLLAYLNKIDYHPSKAPLVIGLIKALGQLHVTDAEPTIRQYLLIENTTINLTCVEALSNFGGKENLTYLTKRLLYVDFSIRKAIIKNLTGNPDLGYQLLYRFLTDNLKFVVNSKKQQKIQSEVSEALQKIQNIALGIKIMLSNRKHAI